MAAIKPTCMFVLLAVWVGVLLGSCCAYPDFTGGWTEQDPFSNPEYMRLAHYAVSRQTMGKRMFDTVVRLVRVATQVVDGLKYKLKFFVAQSDCMIGRDYYSPDRCRPVGPANKECTAIIANSRQVVHYHCRRSFRG